MNDLRNIVIDSKISLSRNINGFNFPNRLDLNGRNEIIENVSQLFGKTGLPFTGFSTADITPEILCERVFDNKMGDNTEGKIFFVSDDKKLSVLVNYGEHLTIQAHGDGRNIKSTYKQALDCALMLEQTLNIAYTEKLGFLTSDLNKVGTGMRISYVVALPGIKMSNRLDSIKEQLQTYLWTIEPLYDSKGCCLFEIHNTATLGVDEETMLNLAEKLLSNLQEKEILWRRKYCEINDKRSDELINEYLRSYGILKYGTLIDIRELIAIMGVIYLVNSSDIYEKFSYKDAKSCVKISDEQIRKIVKKCLLGIANYYLITQSNNSHNIKIIMADTAREIINEK